MPTYTDYSWISRESVTPHCTQVLVFTRDCDLQDVLFADCETPSRGARYTNQMRLQTPLLLVVAMLASACAATASRPGTSPVAGPTPIPWISTTPASMLAPTPTPTMIPAGTAFCRATDLVPVFGGIGALTGGQLSASVLLGNRTGVACQLQGLPGIQLFDASGHQIQVTAVPQGLPAAAILVGPNTGDVQPHVERAGIAYIEFEWATHDGAGNACVPTPPTGTAVGVSLPSGGGSLRVAVIDPLSRWNVIAPCYSQVRISAIQGWPAPEPSPSPDFSQLAVSIDVPTSVTAGSTLRYTVTLRNTASQPFTFGPSCPTYGEWTGGGPRPFAKDFYVLNCTLAPAIRAGQGVTFAMQMTVPADAVPGQYTILWNFIGPAITPGLPARATVSVTP